jgi:hypothetical protein
MRSLFSALFDLFIIISSVDNDTSPHSHHQTIQVNKSALKLPTYLSFIMCTVDLQRRTYETIMPKMTNDSSNEEHHLRMLPFDLLSLESDENGIPNLQPRMPCEMYENDDVGAAPGMKQQLVDDVSSHGRLPNAEYTHFLPRRLACETNGACIPMRVCPTMNPFHQQQDMFCESSSCRQHQSRESGWMASLSEPSQGNDLVGRIPQTPQVMKQVLERMPSPPPCRYSNETPECVPRLMSPPCARVLFPEF